MKSKGFTLIELLAVIVILAIIALIATPIILDIIGNAKSESNERNKELYLDAVKDAIARKNLTEEFNPSECTVQKDGNLKCEGKNLQVEVNGTKPCSGKITFDKKGKITNETIKYCDGSEEDIVYSVLNKDGYLWTPVGVTTLEFLPSGRLPEGMSKEDLISLESPQYSNLSDDGKIFAYVTGEKYCPDPDEEDDFCADYGYRNGTVYIYSENGIRLPEDSSNLMEMFYDCPITVIFNDVDTSKVKNMSHMFDNNGYSHLDLSKFDTSNVEDMSYMFTSAEGSLDLSSFDTSNVTNMSHMFDNSESDWGSLLLKEIKFGENFDTSKVKDMSYMFYEFGGEVLDLSIFNTSSVENMSHMFDDLYGDYDLKQIIFGKNFNTSNVTDMSYMFSGRDGLTTLDLSSFDTSKVTDMSSMFSSCDGLTELDLSSFDTHNVKDMSYMFSGDSDLQSLKLTNFNTSNVEDMSKMFYMNFLTTLDLSSFDTSKVTKYSGIFGEAYNLDTIYVSNKWTLGTDLLKDTTAKSYTIK